MTISIEIYGQTRISVPEGQRFSVMIGYGGKRWREETLNSLAQGFIRANGDFYNVGQVLRIKGGCAVATSVEKRTRPLFGMGLGGGWDPELDAPTGYTIEHTDPYTGRKIREHFPK